MICSLNEIGAMLRKAAVGSGFPTGPADDLAAAGMWLCTRRLDGVGAVLDGIAAGFSPESGWKVSSAALHLRDVPAGQCGSSPFELLVTEDVDTIIVERSSAPLLLVGLAGIVARATDTAFAFSTGAGSPTVVHQSIAIEEDHFLTPSAIIRITLADRADFGPDRPPAPALGIEVDERRWAEASALAARTHVPASEASRHRGAGGGLQDND